MSDSSKFSRIYDYLSAPIEADDEEVDLLVDRISHLQKQTSDVDMRKVNINRLLASNSLKRSSNSSEMKMWEKANQFVAFNISNGVRPSIGKILELNSILTGNPRNFRKIEIFTGNESYLPANELKEALDVFEKEVIENSLENTPLERAFHFYIWLVNLHPFTDGNGRTSRLVADWILITNDYLPTCYHSAIASHVVQLPSMPPRDKRSSYIGFLKSIERAYRVGLSQPTV